MKQWTIRGARVRLELARGSAGQAVPVEQRLSAARVLRAWDPHDPVLGRTLADMCRELGLAGGDLGRLPRQELVRLVAEALESGLLVAREVQPAVYWGDGPPAPEPEAIAEQEPESAWIGLEVVDRDGKPMGGASFVLVLPDGSEKSGKLDAAGRAHVAGIPAGQCRLRLPDLEKPGKR